MVPTINIYYHDYLLVALLVGLAFVAIKSLIELIP